MSWNYRVMRTIERGETCFAIHEVYYQTTGEIFAWTERPSTPFGESLKEIQADHQRMFTAFTRPILDVVRDGDELYDVGLMGRRPPRLVFKRSEQPQSVDAVDPVATIRVEPTPRD